MKIGLVTVTFNSGDVLEEFLQSVDQQTYKNFQLYLVDNASRDQTLEVFSKYKDRGYQLIANAHNNGVAGGNNQGIQAALDDGCEFVLLINNDTVFEKNLLKKLLDGYTKYGDSVITPKMMYYDPKDVIWYAGGYFNRQKAWLNYHRGQFEKDIGQFNADAIVEYAPTCCTLIHKSVFEDIGMMDEKYFVYFDDTDFFYRIARNGKHIVRYLYDIQFYHKIGSLTKSRSSGRKTKLGDFFIRQMTTNQIYYLKKQKKLYGYIYIVYFIFRIQLRFLLTNKYNHNFSTYWLIQKSIWQGLMK